MRKLLILTALLMPVLAFAGKPQKNTKTVTYSVSMDCRNCEKKIVENISFEKGVKDLSTSLSDKTVTVTYDSAKTDSVKLADAIRRLGYKVSFTKQ